MSDVPNPACGGLDTRLSPQTTMGSLILAQQILFRLAAGRDDPRILQNIALWYLVDTLTPAGVRCVLAAERLDDGGGR